MGFTWTEYSRAVPLHTDDIRLAQSTLGVVFPQGFVEMMMEYQGMFLEECFLIYPRFCSMGPLSHFTETASSTENIVSSTLRKRRNGYPEKVIPFTQLGQPHFALDFRYDEKHPSIVWALPDGDKEENGYWDFVHLADSISELFSKFRPHENFFNVAKNTYACDQCDFTQTCIGLAKPQYRHLVEGGRHGSFWSVELDYHFGWCSFCAGIGPLESFKKGKQYYASLLEIAVDKKKHDLEQGEIALLKVQRYKDMFETTDMNPRCLDCMQEPLFQENIPPLAVARHECGGLIKLIDLDYIEVENPILLDISLPR